jgi:hypothetical protein
MSRGYPIVSPALDVDAQVTTNAWTTFTPQIQNTGAGATPTYVTNSGRFMVTNNNVRCDILLDGNGGTAGSGGGQLQISLPVLPSANRLAGFIEVGYYVNGTEQSLLFATLSASSVFMTLSLFVTTGGGAPTISSFTGADQGNATRTIRLHFWYEADELPP